MKGRMSIVGDMVYEALDKMGKLEETFTSRGIIARLEKDELDRLKRDLPRLIKFQEELLHE